MQGNLSVASPSNQADAGGPRGGAGAVGPGQGPGPGAGGSSHPHFASIAHHLSLGKLSGVYVWAILIVIFSLWLPDVFPTVTTLRNIAGSQAIVGIVTVGLLFALAAGAFDLSVGYAVGTLSIIIADLLRSGMNPATAIVITLLLAVAIGIANGVVVVVLGIDSFIATLGVSSILEAIGIWVSNDQEIVGLPHGFTQLAQAQPLGIPMGVIYLVVLAIIAHCVLEHTSMGRQLFAIGSGREAARLAGVPVRFYTFVTLVLTALGAGIAAILLAGTVGSASPSVGPEYLLPAFAAAFLGATQIKPGRFNVPGAVVATYLLATGSSGLELAGAPTWVPYAFDGVALILAVSLGVIQGRVTARRLVRRRRAAAQAARAAELGVMADAG